MHRVFALISLFAALVAAPVAAHAVPGTITVNGRIAMDAEPIDGDVAFTFRLYDQAAGGSELWSEDQTITAVDGLVVADLGAATSLDLALFDGSAIYLEIAIGSDELDPRLSLGTVPYAFRAAVATDAELLRGYAPGDFQQRVDGACASGEYIAAIAADGSVMCAPDADSGGDITGVNASTGLVGGGTSGDVSLGIDPGVTQRRITANCPSGSSIRQVLESGQVLCQTDTNSGGDITGVNAGFGLVGGGTSGTVTLAADTNIVQQRITTDCGATGAVRSVGANGIAACQSFIPASPSVSEYSASSNTTTPVTTNAGSHRFCALAEAAWSNSGGAGVYRYCSVDRAANGTWSLSARSNGAALAVSCRMYCF